MRATPALLVLMFALTCGCWELRPGTDEAPLDHADEAVVLDGPPDVRSDGGAEDAEVSVDVDAAEVGMDAPETAVDAGPMTLRGTFVPATVQGDGGGYVLRGVVTWHARVQGVGGGYTLEGWIR
jgi:hypothetical protein